MPLLRGDQITVVPPTKVVLPLLYNNTGEVTVSNTITETQVFSFTLPGGQMGANDAIYLEAASTLVRAAAATETLRLKYGGTTIATATFSPANTLTSKGNLLNAMIKNVGATNSQKGVLLYCTGTGNAPIGGVGTAAVDSTVNQAIVLTVQFSVANAGNTFVQWGVNVYYVPAI